MSDIRKKVLYIILLTCAAAVIFVVSAVVLPQYIIYSKEKRILLDQRESLSMTLQKLEVVSSDLPKIARKKAEREEKLKKWRIRIPHELEEESFLINFQRWSKKHNLKVKSINAEESQTLSFGKGKTIDVVFSNDIGKVEKAFESIDETERYISLIEMKQDVGETRVRFSIFSIKPVELENVDVEYWRQERCPKFESEVWLWPFAEKIEDLIKMNEYICSNLPNFAERRAYLNELKNLKRELDAVEAAIEQIEKSKRIDTSAEVK